MPERAELHALPAPESMLGLAAELTSWGLGRELVLPAAPLVDDMWGELLVLIGRHRATGFAVQAVEAGAFPLSERQRRELLDVHGFLVRRVLHLEVVMTQIVDQLDKLGIEHRLLKGAALAHTVYPDPVLRPYADIDILVRSGDLDAVIDALVQTCARRVHVEPRPGFVRRFGKGVELVRPDGVSIDLHRALAPGVWAVLMDPAALFATSTELVVAGRTVYGLGSAERFVHACYHATVGSRELKLVALRDVVHTAIAPDFDELAALDLAASWESSSVVAGALRLAWDVLRPATRPGLMDWAVAHRPQRRDERRFAVRAGLVDDPGASEIVEMLRVLPGLRAKLAYASGLAFPASDYLAERGQSRLSRLIKGVRLVGRSR